MTLASFLSGIIVTMMMCCVLGAAAVAERNDLTPAARAFFAGAFAALAVFFAFLVG